MAQDGQRNEDKDQARCNSTDGHIFAPTAHCYTHRPRRANLTGRLAHSVARRRLRLAQFRESREL
jgi:hypothetical protein